MTLTTIKTYLRSSVAQNAASLYVIQFAGYILPLITVPYVVRVLTPHGYGLVAFGTGLIGYFITVVDYGFAYSATRRISVQRDDLAAVNRIAFNVWAAKLVLCLSGFLVLTVLTTLVPSLREIEDLLFILYGLVLGNVLFPTWLYQGLERMVPISVINLLVRLLVVVGIFTLVKRPEDYLWYAGLNSLGSIAAGLAGIATAFYLFPLLPIIPVWQDIREALAEGWVLFLSMLSNSLYSVGNPFILGMVTNPTVVGYFSAGEKLVRAVVSLICPLAGAVYPRFSKMANDSKTMVLKWSCRMLFLTGGVGLIFSIILLTAAPVIVHLALGTQYKASSKVIQILAILPLLIAASNIFGVQIMLPFGMDRLFAGIMIGGGIINILLGIILSYLIQELGMAIAVLCSEVFVSLAMFAVLWKYELNPVMMGQRWNACKPPSN